MFTDLLVNVFDIAFDTFINVIEMVSTSQAHVFFAYEASLCGKIEEVKIFLRISQLGQEFSAEYRRKEKKKKRSEHHNVQIPQIWGNFEDSLEIQGLFVFCKIQFLPLFSLQGHIQVCCISSVLSAG